MTRGVRLESLRNIVDLLDRRAELHPDDRAFTFLRDGQWESERLGFGDLQRKARAVGQHLQSLGLTGQAALLLFPPGLDFIVAFYGCLYAGTIAIPAVAPNAKKSLPNLEAIMADAKATTILTSSALAPKLDILFEGTDRAQQYRQVVTDSVPDAAAADYRPVALGHDSLAFLQYTSGSTGSPKGVMVSHGNLLHNHDLLRRFFEIDETSVYVSWLPHHHDMGLIGQIMESVYVGIPCHLMAPAAFVRRPYAWLKAIQTYRATISGAPNFAYQLCADRVSDEQLVDLDLSSWRVAFNGAEPVRHSTQLAFQRRFARSGFSEHAFFPCYGMAEATLIITGGRVDAPPGGIWVDKAALEQNRIVEVAADHPDAHALVCCGKTNQDQVIRIVDPADGQVLPARRIGEIWLSGGSVCQGYLNQADLTERSFRARLPDDPDRVFARSGDLGFTTEDGDVYISGRLKDVLIVRGRNHYPQDIEFVVANSHPALSLDGIAAFSIDVADEERVVVAAEARRSAAADFDLDAIAAAVATALTEAFELTLHGFALLRPGRVPKTSSGKLQRSVARRAYLARELDALAYWQAPVSSTSAASHGAEVDLGDHDDVAAWLQRLLGDYLGLRPDEIDREVPLSRYGLDSELSLRVVGDISTLTRRELEPTLIWDTPTVNGLAAHIALSA